MNKCNCNTCTSSDDKSRAMYSIDYDSLIEKLENTRDEIDSVIKLLRDKKDKDSMINSILSEEYDDDNKDNTEDKIDEVLDLLMKIQKQRIPYKDWYPYRWYPTITYTTKDIPKTFFK